MIVRLSYLLFFYILLPFLSVRNGILTAKRQYESTGGDGSHSSSAYYNVIMRPSSLGGGRILRRTLSVCLSVCPSVPLLLPSVTSRHLANYNDTCSGPHIVRPSRPHKFLFSYCMAQRLPCWIHPNTRYPCELIIIIKFI